MKKHKKNDKGITLVELLIALAIGSIVISAVIILLRQGINSYSKQTISAQLQNDADITLNQMTDAIMEANCINIYNNRSGTGDTPDFITKIDETDKIVNAYSYDTVGKVLYVGNQLGSDNNYKKLGVLCKNVASFKVQILKSSVKVEKRMEDIDGAPTQTCKMTQVNNPVQIKVSIKLQYNNMTREVSRVTSIRNELDVSKFTLQNHSMDAFSDIGALDNYFTD